MSRFLLKVLIPALTFAAIFPSQSFSAVVISQDRPATKAVAKVASTGQVRYEHGQPSTLEQQLLEMINRARAHPTEEIHILLGSGDAYIQSAIADFEVDTAQVIADFAGYSPQPPLVLNAKLTESAWGHAVDMAENDFQSHVGSDGSRLRDRLERVAYPYRLAGENVFAYAQSVLHAHAAFLIDWGVPELGHRANLLNLGSQTDFREVGLSVLSENDPATSVGPWLVTQDFGTADPNVVFITGVAFRDDNNNGMYDPDEGLSGVEIRPDRGDYYAVTSLSGGYAIPASVGSGPLAITAGREDLVLRQGQISVADVNLKVDFVYGNPQLGRITGTVVDEQGRVLAGAAIQLEGEARRYVTAEDGRFLFTDLPAGSHTLHAERENYEFAPNDFDIYVVAGENFQTRLTGTRTDVPAGGEPVNPGTDPNQQEPLPDGTQPWCGFPLLVILPAILFGTDLLRPRRLT